ncbi:protein containing Transposase, IS605 OrfB, partial [mine drainage metagenome]
PVEPESSWSRFHLTIVRRNAPDAGTFTRTTGLRRPSQGKIVCQRCGLKDNADQNASRVIAQRGIRLLLEGDIQKKRVRRCGIGKEKQPGQESCVK